jgi:curved DNA-binding protein CbpA
VAKTQTLYDILEVSPQASTEAIQASYERLKNKFLEGQLKSDLLEPSTHFNLIKDAYQTLSNPSMRDRYDARLAGSARQAPAVVYADTSYNTPSSGIWKWVLIAVLGICAVIYFQAKTRLEAEQLRIAAEALKIQQEQIEQQKQQQEAQAQLDQARAAERAASREAAEAARQRAELSRTSDRINRDLSEAARQAEREDEKARRQSEYKQQQLESQRRRDAAEAERRIEREKALARQLERENHSGPSRTGGISR